MIHCVYMARRSLDERNIRKITRTGSSMYITIPIEFIRDLGWRERQKVTVEKKGKRLIIEDWQE